LRRCYAYQADFDSGIVRRFVSLRIIGGEDHLESYYGKLMDGVRQMIKQETSLDEIKKEPKIAGTEVREGQARFANNIESAYRGIMGN
jgi:hypothetical protein